jgi:hypothetical protein
MSIRPPCIFESCERCRGWGCVFWRVGGRWWTKTLGMDLPSDGPALAAFKSTDQPSEGTASGGAGVTASAISEPDCVFRTDARGAADTHSEADAEADAESGGSAEDASEDGVGVVDDAARWKAEVRYKPKDVWEAEVARIAANDSSLHTLYWAEQEVHDDGGGDDGDGRIGALCAALRSNTTLHTLFLQYNRLSATSIALLKDAIDPPQSAQRTAPPIRQLYLHGNRLREDDDHDRDLVRAIQGRVRRNGLDAIARGSTTGGGGADEVTALFWPVSCRRPQKTKRETSTGVLITPTLTPTHPYNYCAHSTWAWRATTPTSRPF